MQSFLQFLIVGLGSGAVYAMFAQGAVLIYRGSGLVNFGQGAIGTLAAYVTFVDLQQDRGVPTVPALLAGIAVAVAVSLLFQWLVLRPLRSAAPIVRVIATVGLLGLVQAVVVQRYGATTVSVDEYLPHDVWIVGGVAIQEQRVWLVAISALLTGALWAWTRYTRTGLAISASAQNERAVQTLGWSPNRLAAVTWGLGGGIGGLAAVLVAPLTGLSPVGLTIVVTIAALAAALLGGFSSFPLTFVGGLVVGLGEALATRYNSDIERWLHQSQITGLNRAAGFLVILVVLVLRGRSLPLRSHVADRLPRLGSGVVNARGVLIGAAVTLALLFGVFGDSWAQATYVSLATGVMVLSIVVLTGYAGQLSLAQWALAGIGALAAGQLVRHGLPVELAIPLGVLITVAVGAVFALPALRTRGVNLAVVTLGLGFTVSEVVFANGDYLGDGLDGGTRIGPVTLFGLEVDAVNHPHRWAVVCLVAFVVIALVVANLRRSRTGRRLIAVRTNERAATSLGISVVGVKLYAFAVAAGIAAVGGILTAFQFSVIKYDRFDVFTSVSQVGFAVIGGLGYALGAVFAAPNAVGGLGSEALDALFGLGGWITIIGAALVILMLLANQHGIADVVVRHHRGRAAARRAETPVELAEAERVAPATLRVAGLTVRFGAVVAVADVGFEVHPGEIVGLIGPNGAGKTTIIDAVTGFVKPSAGTIHLDDAAVHRLGATRRARLGIRRSFQSLELFDDLPVEDNLRAGSEAGASRISWLTDLIWPVSRPLSPTALAAVRGFELEEHLRKLPGELPYGRRRHVGIARALASGPSILLLDEPAAGLDEAESRELASLIRELATERGMGILLVEHDMPMVMSTCDRIVCIEFGKVIATGTPDQVRGDPAVVAAYLGTAEPESESEPEVVDAGEGRAPAMSES
ncbi:ATP-binding cassette domain-containing protein [Frankia sp. CNm7]|uniref:ATP-binding cassette domain-containing protein n=1 Tax=Frankia nepalensis TaxID=1836974 RepID=A0A937UVX2_9ACTN|nr:branched-chain amino acid ABC transporter permease/ATP-binding protein [Frankia nepalensis]MBL7500995.1 ATP-binding cassette domain-containing protein [Frankia nepalensis]MBL7512459.1 ATP-binding cassette domain-containing protein [Frankia nepalensis]MBL7521524.1 ATP-binding cassette domain-containing protein [Frankia nepalensis]MBL7632761.1 ATP-binding cassette domain-containing protein [Frankia nepalensis]